MKETHIYHVLRPAIYPLCKQASMKQLAYYWMGGSLVGKNVLSCYGWSKPIMITIIMIISINNNNTNNPAGLILLPSLLLLPDLLHLLLLCARSSLPWAVSRQPRQDIYTHKFRNSRLQGICTQVLHKFYTRHFTKTRYLQTRYLHTCFCPWPRQVLYIQVFAKQTPVKSARESHAHPQVPPSSSSRDVVERHLITRSGVYFAHHCTPARIGSRIELKRGGADAKRGTRE